jgi:hypothetical protein
MRFASLSEQLRGMSMKIATTLALAVGIAALAGCNKSPQENTAANIEANGANQAENITDTANNEAENITANAENKADEVKNQAENKADAVRNSAGNSSTNKY